MKRTRLALIALLAVAALSATRPAAADDNPLEFIHALLERGYADVAVEYLNDLKTNNALSGDASVTFDFEMSRCLQSQARQAYNADELKLLTDKSKEYLAKFLKEHPEHPKAIEAVVWWASFATDDATKHLQAAQTPRSKGQEGGRAGQARTALEEAQPKLLQAAAKFEEQMKKARRRKDREELEAKWQNTFFRAILCNYYIAQTYPEHKDPKPGDTEKGLRGIRLGLPAQPQQRHGPVGPHVARQDRHGEWTTTSWPRTSSMR